MKIKGTILITNGFRDSYSEDKILLSGRVIDGSVSNGDYLIIGNNVKVPIDMVKTFKELPFEVILLVKIRNLNNIEIFKSYNTQVNVVDVLSR